MSSVSLNLSAKEYPLTVVDGTELQLTLTGPTGPQGESAPAPILRSAEEGDPSMPQTLAMVISGTASPNYNGSVPLLGLYNGRECFSTNPDALADPAAQSAGEYATAIYYDATKWVIKHTEYTEQPPFPSPTINSELQINGLYVTGGPETVTGWMTGNPTVTRSQDEPLAASALGQLCIVAEADVYVATRVSPAKWVKINN